MLVTAQNGECENNKVDSVFTLQKKLNGNFMKLVRKKNDKSSEYFSIFQRKVYWWSEGNEEDKKTVLITEGSRDLI